MDLSDFNQESLLNRYVDFLDPTCLQQRTAKVIQIGTRKRFSIGRGSERRSKTKAAVKVKFHTTDHYGLTRTERLIPLENVRVVYLRASPQGRRGIPFDEWVIRNRRRSNGGN